MGYTIFYFVKQEIFSFSTCFSVSLFAGNQARELFKNMRREAAAIRIQKYARRYQAHKAYKQLRLSAIFIQAGLRAMVARNEFCFRSQTKASIIIQVFSFASLANGWCQVCFIT